MLRGGGGSGDNVHLTLCVVKSICKSSLRMELSKERLRNFFKDFKEFWVDLENSVNREKLTSWYEGFSRDYPEAFRGRKWMLTKWRLALRS